VPLGREAHDLDLDLDLNLDHGLGFATRGCDYSLVPSFLLLHGANHPFCVE
jgi:hypothetical protein